MKCKHINRRWWLTAMMASVVCFGLLGGCEDGDDDNAEVRVRNNSADTILVRIDGEDLRSVLPEQLERREVTEGTHVVQLLKEDGSLIFEQSIDVEECGSPPNPATP